MRKESVANWVCGRMYHKVWKLQQEWAMSDGSDPKLRARSVSLSSRYKRLCKILDNR